MLLKILEMVWSPFKIHQFLSRQKTTLKRPCIVPVASGPYTIGGKYEKKAGWNQVHLQKFLSAALEMNLWIPEEDLFVKKFWKT